MALYLTKLVNGQVQKLRVSPTKAIYRGFWAIIIGGFAGTSVTCNGVTKFIGSSERVAFNIITPGTYIFTATRQGTTITKEVVLNDDIPEYIINLSMFIGMQPLEYIESTGTQYIDTGISGNNDELKLECEFIITEIPGDWSNIYGNYVNENSNSFRLVINGNTHNGFFTSNTQTRQGQIGYSFQTNTKYTIESSYLKSIINSTTYNYSQKIIGDENNTTILLFNSSTISGFLGTPIKLYSFKIYDNEVLVRDFIPIKDDTGHGALYDKVTQQIFYNSGTGVFICGPNKPYRRIQYIESTGTQWIDSGVAPDQDTSVEIKYNLTALSGNTMLFGSRRDAQPADASNGIFRTLTTYVNRVAFGTGNGTNINLSGTIGQTLNTDFVIKFKKNEIYYNNVLTTTIPVVTETWHGDYNMYLGAVNTAGTTQYPVSAKIYYTKIWDNDTLVRDFVPVLDYDGTPCMLDRVEDKLYYNQGTGEYIAGPEKILPDEYVELEYIETDPLYERQWIDSEYIPNNKSVIEYNVQLLEVPNGRYVFGNYDPGSQYYMYTNNSTSKWEFGWSSIYTTSSNNRDTDFHSFSLYTYNGTSFMKCDDNIVASAPTTSQIETHTLPLLSGRNNSISTEVALTLHQKFFGCKIWDNSVLVRDLIPAKRISDNVVGMYDTISQQFFTNAGTGSFIAGPEK